MRLKNYVDCVSLFIILITFATNAIGNTDWNDEVLRDTKICLI
ncbi:MAG: hypothetical protein ACD_69C00340G0003 [uncultured bacterium]|nr:MAG: hypothetical protein ACD_69C00340G0003 [uncultured bacterium]